MSILGKLVTWDWALGLLQGEGVGKEALWLHRVTVLIPWGS